jgi:DNA-binding GntR family transcriptional regulator
VAERPTSGAASVLLERPQGWRHHEKFARSLYSGTIVAHLREEIVAGRLGRGASLVERQLAGEFGVSRGPVRSALQVLEAEGLVETLPNGRMIVAGFGHAELLSLFDVRLLLESTAVRAGVARRGDVSGVTAALEAFVQLDYGSSRWVDVDMGFHRAIVELAQSRFLLQVWLALAPVLHAAITVGQEAATGQFSAQAREHIVAFHVPIAEAITAYDADAAIRLLEEQFRDAAEVLRIYYAQGAQV